MKKLPKRTKAEQDKINLKRGTDNPYSKDNQPSNEAKSRGQINARKELNLLLNLETELNNRPAMLKNFVDALDAEVKNGKLDNYIKTANLFKSNDKNTNINVQGVQKIFVTQEELQEVDKHIDDIIGE